VRRGPGVTIRTVREIARTVASFAAARWGRRFASRDALVGWQQGRIRSFLADHASRAPFFAQYAGAALADLPIVDKTTVVANFAAFNRRRISLDRAMAAALAAERSRDFSATLDGITVGLSSGTSGSRGVFLVSPEERQRWAGQVLGRLLSPALFAQVARPWSEPVRIAFFLRANSNLYETVRSRRIRFGFYDLLEPFVEHLRRLNASRPHVLVAPPSVLRQLAIAALDGLLQVAPAQVVSVAEVLEPDDRTIITRAFRVNVQEVYQATEGFLGASCPAGRLHLNEDLIHVEPEWIDVARQRFHPIITDFTRTTQLTVRYRLDDVLRVGETACPCGQVTLTLDAIEGRADDVLFLTPVQGGPSSQVFPDTVRRSMALTGITSEYRIEQHGDRWRVQLDGPGDESAARAHAIQRELDVLADGLGLRRPTLQFDSWSVAPEGKRRRIRCITPPIGLAS
jgi:putative adenylate-forming enzyme